MSTMPNPFPYSSLNPDKHEIRVITIAPEKHEQKPVRCSLQHVSLDEKPTFEALSYVWGNPAATTEIFVNNQSFPVTTNLAAALRSLRHPKKTRTLWADFICIDQQNTKEKNTQLPLMGRIYRDATAVVAWLGPLTPNIEQTQLMMKERSSTWNGMTGETRKIKSLFSIKSRRQSLVSTTRAIEGFIEVVSAPYWKRVWTFQEYYLPSKEPVCMFGDITFSVPALVELHKHFLEVLVPFMQDIKKIAPRPNDAADAADHKELSARAREFKGKLQEFSNLKDFAHDLVALRKSSWSFADVLELTVDRQCYNPLDRFYGLYALVPGIQQKYRANYDNEPEVAMLQTTMFILIHEGSDCVFNFFHFYEGPRKKLMGDPLPSWVPDYRSRTGYSVTSLDKSLHDWEAEDRMTNLSLLPGLYVLHFWARPVGRCQIVFRFPPDLSEIVHQVLKTDSKTGATWKNGLDESNFTERFLWACLGQTRLQKDFTFKEILGELTELHHALRDGKDIPRKPYTSCMRPLVDALRNLAGRTVFRLTDSQAGGFGIGIHGIQDGDLLILSGKMGNPVALRHRGSLSRSDDEVHYDMIGNAFVEGIAEEQENGPTPLVAELRKREHEKFLIV